MQCNEGHNPAEYSFYGNDIWHVTIWQDASLEKVKVTECAIQVLVMTDGDGDDKDHVPTSQLASGLTLATHCTGLQMKCKFCKISQKICTTLCNCTSALHCIFSPACGALGGGRYVLVKRNYTQCRGIMQRDQSAEFFLHEVCIVSWPWAWAAGGPMIVITVHPITWPTHPPSRPSTNVQCNAMQMQLNTLQ